MSNQPQNNKEGTAVLGSLVFMALYALGIWHNAVRGNIPFLILWSVLLLINVGYLIFRLKNKERARSVRNSGLAYFFIFNYNLPLAFFWDNNLTNDVEWKTYSQ